MFSPRSVMALVAVLVLSAKVAESAIAAPDVCTAADVGKGFCLNCKTKAMCVTADSPPESSGECTVAGEACTVLAGVATCRPIAETACSCDQAAQCDAYDPDSVLICLSGGVTISNDCSLTGETCVDGTCDTPATTDSTVSPEEVCVGAPDGFVVITPMCTTAVYCLSEEPLGPIDCTSGTYFDVAENNCMPLPPVPCAGCGSGACPDKSNCSKFYICDEVGTVLDEETCDAATPVFDIDSNNCLADGTCTGNADCTFGLTTIAETTGTSSDGGSTTSGTGSTSRPSECTAANVGQRYPYEGDCKKYWSCVQVGSGQYGYVEGTCLGELVFNPDTAVCDAQANVPGCVPLS